MLEKCTGERKRHALILAETTTYSATTAAGVLRQQGVRAGRGGRGEREIEKYSNKPMPDPRVPKFRVPAALVSPASLFLVGGIVYYFSLDKPSEDELNTKISKEFPDVRLSMRSKWGYDMIL